jgi:HTH-type transcriptional regulator / antitoxin HipB
MKDDLDKYISRRKKRDGKFAERFESGYQELKVGVLLRQARAISRLENHAEDVRLSTIERVAHALGKNLVIQLVKA